MSDLYISADWADDQGNTFGVVGPADYVIENLFPLVTDTLSREALLRRLKKRHEDIAKEYRKKVCEAVAAHYSAKFKGTVNCDWDVDDMRYVITGSNLPSDLPGYPNGWCLLDYLDDSTVDSILKGKL